MVVQGALPSQMSMHKTNHGESNVIPAEWWRGRRGWFGTTVHPQTSACAPPLPEHELTKSKSEHDLKDKARAGNQMKAQEPEERRVSSSVILNLLSWLHPPYSASPYSPYPHFSPLSLPASPPLSPHSPSSGPWSICDPDIHRRRHPSCV